MMCHTFKNIPENIINVILSYPPEDYEPVYRAIWHRGPLEATDFYPSFKDKKQQERRKQMGKKGGMANFVSKQVKLKKGDCSVSLSASLDEIKHQFHPSSEAKKLYPFIAVGKTCRERGVAHKDNDRHISYYLYDYENNNPYVDFKILEENEK